MARKRGIRVYRVFFNRRGAPKTQAWSVDTGESTRRRHFADITICVPAIGIYNGKDPDWKNPIAWFEACGRLQVDPSGERAAIVSGETR